jgi:hypothetical protein
MKTLKNPSSSALSYLSNPALTGSPLHLERVFFMEKSILIQDLGQEYPNINSKKKYHFAIYKCYCGNTFRCQTSHFNSGHTTSCGCYQVKVTTDRCFKHGMSNTKIFYVWANMITKCYNKKYKQYKDYGGRGIKMCNEWLHDSTAFINWAMSHGYKEGLQINRINNDGNYEPSNCKFSDRPEQTQNTRLLMVTNTSGYRGVSRKHNKWVVQIGWNRKKYKLGSFDVLEKAAQVYNDFVVKNNTYHPLNIIKK